MTFQPLDLDNLRNDQTSRVQMPLFSHQLEAIEKLSKFFDFREISGKGGLLVLPTGGGKTFTAVKWISENVFPKNCKVLWLAHSFHLLDQACDTFVNNARWIPFPKTRLNIRVVSSNPSHSRAADILPTDDLLIMTTPSAISNFFEEGLNKAGGVLESGFKKFLKSVSPDRLFLVLDEAHHSPAYGCRKLLCSIRELLPSHFLLGLTATPDYSDEARRGWLFKLFGETPIYAGKKTDLQAQKILARENIIQRRTNFEFEVDDKLYNRLVREHKDLPEEIIENLSRNSARNDFIVQEYLKNREKYGKTIIFVDRWFQCEYLKGKLERGGIKVDTVYSHVDAPLGSPEERNRRTADENKKIIEKFKNDEFEVMINVKMLTEGTDIPKTKTVFITRETTSRILLTQMIGRALRGEKAGGGLEKAEANIVFFSDTWKKSIFSIIRGKMKICCEN